jgi:hypothetical protein
LTEHLEVEEPEFKDTFDRPAWWHRQQWLSTRPAGSLPRKKLDREWTDRAYIREGIPVRVPVQADPQRIRSRQSHLRSTKWSANAGEPHTYLVKADGTHLVKIGIAKDPKRRLQVLQTGQPMDLYLMWSVPGDYEHALHQRFAKYRHRGEWFDLRELGDPVAVVTDALNEIRASEPTT